MPVDPTSFFREVTLRICGSLDIDEAIQDAFSYVSTQLPIDMMGLGFNDLEPETGESPCIQVVTTASLPGAKYIWDNSKPYIPLPRDTVEYIRALAPDRPTAILVNQPLEEDEPLIRVFPGLRDSSALFLRLEVRNQVVGALLASCKGHGRFTEEHGRLIDSVREPIAIAMLNARRFRELTKLKDALAEDNRELKQEVNRQHRGEVVGADFGLRDVMDQVRKLAQSNSPVLLLGETGTGKEVIANALHLSSRRNTGPLVTIQCGAVPESLLDSELFGHEEGAFTGATSRRVGRFERAHGGTLFLDEVGELSLDAQVKLLRVLQEKRFERIGGNESIEVDVRVIAATHRDLESMVSAGQFREDLWYRLSVLPIRIPPLRLRREDIPSLVRYFIRVKSKDLNIEETLDLSSQDIDRLTRYDWPGNVRELQNVVERALILSRDGRLQFPELLSPSTQDSGKVASATPQYDGTLDEVVASHIRKTLERTDWKISGPDGAAELLGVNPSTLRFRMKKLGIRR